MPNTIICDIDGVIFRHHGKGACHQWSVEPELLGRAQKQFDTWEKNGDYIILMTARKESCRLLLEAQLRKHKLFWDLLIMGVPHGQRVLINDTKQGGLPSAEVTVIERNKGL